MAGTIALTEWGSAGPEERARLIGRPEGALKMFDPELSRSVGEIVLDVKENGDDAIVRALSRFDGCEVEPDRIRVSEEEFERARAGIDPDLAAAIRVGIDNVRSFSERAIADLDWREEIAEGLVVGEKATPIESAGLFVPSGKGSYPSVLIQIGAPAVTAKVANIAVVVPPVAGGGGEVDPGVLFVASELGISDVFRVNGRDLPQESVDRKSQSGRPGPPGRLDRRAGRARRVPRARGSGPGPGGESRLTTRGDQDVEDKTQIGGPGLRPGGRPGPGRLWFGLG